MLDTNLEPLPHSLDCECPIPWPADQESKIGTDYPFTYVPSKPQFPLLSLFNYGHGLLEITLKKR